MMELQKDWYIYIYITSDTCFYEDPIHESDPCGFILFIYFFWGEGVAKKSFVVVVIEKDGWCIKDTMKPRGISALCRYYFVQLTSQTFGTRLHKLMFLILHFLSSSVATRSKLYVHVNWT